MKLATVFGAVALCVTPVFSSVLLPTGTVGHNYTLVPSGAPSAVPAHLLSTRNLQNETLPAVPKLGNFGFKRTPVRQSRRFNA
ncbi:hypothetical protein DTO271G3_7544 [Paecilomyces variotii]|nr:hypothetical protein DTO271G3_7544 [Paecilomyces variotii]